MSQKTKRPPGEEDSYSDGIPPHKKQRTEDVGVQSAAPASHAPGNHTVKDALGTAVLTGNQRRIENLLDVCNLNCTDDLIDVCIELHPSRAKDISEIKDSMEQWKELSKLMLLATAWKFFEKTKKDVGPTLLFKDCYTRTLDHADNTPALQSLTECGIFNPQQVQFRSDVVDLRSACANQGRRFLGKQILTDTRSYDMLYSRSRVGETSETFNGQLAVAEPAILPQKDRVSVVAGESGSGKTATAIATASDESGNQRSVCVYLMMAGGKVTDEKYHVQMNTDEDESEKDVEAAKNDRDTKAVEHIKTLLTNVLNQRSVQLTATYDGRVCIVLDELGSQPNLLRAICSARARLATMAADVLRVNSADNVQLIALGTGVETHSTAVGSCPDSYTLRHMADFKDKLGGMALLRQDHDPWMRSVLKFIESPKSQRVAKSQKLLENARIAVLFRELWKGLLILNNYRSQFQPTVGVVEGVALNALAVFKSMNGLRDVDGVELNQVFCRALAFSVGTTYNTRLHQSLEDDDNKLLTEYGLLVDNRQPTKENKFQLRAGKSHRYEISHAQVVAGLVSFKVKPREATAEGFEYFMADFATVYLMAGSGFRKSEERNVSMARDPLGELKQVLCDMGADLAFVRRYTSTKHIKEDGLSKLFECMNFESLKPLVGKNVSGPQKFGIVAVNGPKAPYADVICATQSYTFEANRWRGDDDLQVCLIQCKHYVTASLQPYEYQAELFKMDVVTAQSVAGHIAANMTRLPTRESPNVFSWSKSLTGNARQISISIENAGTLASAIIEKNQTNVQQWTKEMWRLHAYRRLCEDQTIITALKNRQTTSTDYQIKGAFVVLHHADANTPTWERGLRKDPVVHGLLCVTPSTCDVAYHPLPSLVADQPETVENISLHPALGTETL